jgi:DNA-binding NarL/FixJ family response regulator
MTRQILIACRQKNANDKLTAVIRGINPRYRVTAVTDEGEMNEAVTVLQPELLFLDAHFALCATAMAAARLHKKFGGMKIAVFERKPRHAEYAARFVLWGVENYLSKREGSNRYEKEIARILKGEDVIPSYVIAEADKYSSLPDCSLKFSKTERKVLAHLRNGLGNPEIADICRLKPGTIGNIVSALYAKTNTDNTILLLNVAANRGVLSEGWIPEITDDDKYDLPERDVTVTANIALVRFVRAGGY